MLLILTVIGLFYFAYRFFYNRYRIRNLHYGVKANSLRMALNVPIIDDYMKVVHRYNQYSGNRWQSKKELPSGNEVLHVWKNVTPLSDTSGLFDEMDGFRKKLNDSIYYQLNIDSRIIGDTIATRTGKLFYYRKSDTGRGLTDLQIDSISTAWGLHYLVRTK
jgi:hypothetical protein